ncbi:MAG: Transcriptional regulator [uncultured Paraburkholderia sp.]|nr:MAG: Transcriptional regulator [uncultured Paraburkholderia sp.]CAH2941063.1 MAG: Transcriptional regulator [uncultured Paraburkholderia sp.]
MNAILPRPAYEDSLMQITFSEDKPAFDGANLTVRFMARMDGEPVVCAITAEALEDHFGADSALETALMSAFDHGCNRIRSVCAEALDQNHGEGVVLHSGLFRLEGMEPDLGAAA